MPDRDSRAEPARRPPSAEARLDARSRCRSGAAATRTRRPAATCLPSHAGRSWGSLPAGTVHDGSRRCFPSSTAGSGSCPLRSRTTRILVRLPVTPAVNPHSLSSISLSPQPADNSACNLPAAGFEPRRKRPASPPPRPARSRGARSAARGARASLYPVDLVVRPTEQRAAGKAPRRRREARSALPGPFHPRPHRQAAGQMEVGGWTVTAGEALARQKARILTEKAWPIDWVTGPLS
jgi:hypothetical protein